MNFRRHELTLDEKVKRKYFRLAVFKGKGGSQTSTTTRNIPAQTANEATLENGLMNYNTTGLNNASNVLNKAINSADSTYNPDYSTLANNYNNSLSSALSSYSNGMSDVLNGKLSDSYTSNREKALNSELSSTVGSAISGLANRGILNSSVTNNALNNISQNASNALASEYSSDLAQQANLLGQNYSNQVSNTNNVLSGNESAQSSSYTKPNSLFSYASSLATPAQNMYNTMYSGRMNSGGTTTTQSGDSGKGGFWSGVGGIGSALITRGK
ncbi:hypothetical protein [Pectinatus frisingensis]|uniref:hypothetical protein n=1 Tax=Pectinatus frisingensis TaxID=865 RepID=UPI0018C7751F|nr:hypothetical protein [Pectinatus frisingensis]